MILHRSALAATLLYTVAAVALTWPLLPHAAQDVPGDLIDPLFTCWALGWNLHYLGLSPGGPQPVSYWDANIFYPTHLSLARSEHFLPQALQGAVVYALTGNLVLTYNVLCSSSSTGGRGLEDPQERVLQRALPHRAAEDLEDTTSRRS